MQYEASAQKCWECGNACTGGCSWARDFTPVKGWTTDIRIDSRGRERTQIIACPEFVPEDRERRRLDLDTEGCILMVETLMELNREDYIRGGEKDREEVERFLRGHGASKVHMVKDPERVIRRLRREAADYQRIRARRAMIAGRVKLKP